EDQERPAYPGLKHQGNDRDKHWHQPVIGPKITQRQSQLVERKLRFACVPGFWRRDTLHRFPQSWRFRAQKLRMLPSGLRAGLREMVNARLTAGTWGSSDGCAERSRTTRARRACLAAAT